MSGYDAGAITASLSVDTSKAKADLDKISAEVKKLEDASHKIKISAVFDNSSLTKARKMFADLDNAISRDSMQRLRSSPQGSVLGALNALFSPHPVTGAPSPQQSASGGLLGKMISGQGGGAPSPGGTSGGTSAAGRTTTTNDIRDVLTGQQPKDTSTTNTIRDVTEGPQPGNVKTEDLITPKVTGSLPGDVKTTDTVKVVTEGGGPKDTTTTDTVKEKTDPASRAQVIKDSGDTGDKAGASFSSMFASHAKSLLGAVAGMFGGGGDKIGKAAGASGSGAGKQFGTSLLDGIGPSILGISAKTMFSKFALLAVGGLAALPALAGVIGTGMGVAMVGGLIAVVAKNSPALKAQLTGIGADAKKMLTTIGAPIIPALTKAFAQIPALLKSITGPLTEVMKTVAPQIAGVFAGLTPIIKGLVGIMQAAAPAFGPVIEGLEKLVAGILPGIQTVIKAMTPFLSQFAGILAKLGTNIGQFFSAAAPAIGASMKVLGALLDVVGGLLPVIVKLGGVFATALAPAISAFAGVIKSLTPFLTIVGNILASLAGAVLGDLVSAFTALATVFTGIAPALSTFASALGVVFTTLENSGVFAILGDAVEALAAPLAALISALLNGLAPALPPLFTAIGQIAAILAGGLAAAVAAVLPPLTTLATTVLAAIAKILPVILPLFVSLAGVFTGGVVTVIQGVASALTAIIKAIPPGVLQGLAIGFLAAFAAAKLLTGAMALLDIALNANPIGLVAIAIAAVGAAMYLAWEKSAGFRNVMKDIASGFLEAGIIIVEINKTIIDSVLTMFGDIIHGAADAFGWVPGIGGKLKAAATDFDNFKNGVNDAFNKTISTMQGWRNELSASAQQAQTSLTGIENAFSAQSKAAADAKTALDTYTQAVQQNGATSTAAQAARTQLITDLTNAGVNATTAQTDVTNYTNAVAQNGTTSTAAQAARQQLITDILGASTNANTGTTDLGNYTAAVQQNGAQSDAAQAARAKLISDLENAGVQAGTAKGLVDGLGNSIADLPAGKNISIDVTGSGTWTITGLQALLGNPNSGVLPTPSGHQQGGKIAGYGGGDSILALLEPGETVLPKEATSDPMTVAVAKKYGVPGFASGGTVSGPTSKAALAVAAAQANLAAIMKSVAAALAMSTSARAHDIHVNREANAAGQARWAAQMVVSRIQGEKHSKQQQTALAAAMGVLNRDQSVLAQDEQALHAAQQARSIADSTLLQKQLMESVSQKALLAAQKAAKAAGVPGFASGGIAGLGGQITASYNATQDAMVKSMQQALIDAIKKAAAAIGPGVPGANTKTGAGDYTLAQLEALWIAAGGNPAAAYNMALIAIAESGGNPNAYNPSGATGLWQIEYPGSQVVAGNLYNPSVNAANAVALYNSRGYEPWEADPVGARLTGYGPAPHGAKGMLVGYGQGGLINEPITGVGVSGRMYKFGEAGPEYVIPGNKATGVPGASGSRVEALLEQLIAVTGSLPHGITGGIGTALSGAAQSASFRSRYPRGGA